MDAMDAMDGWMDGWLDGSSHGVAWQVLEGQATEQLQAAEAQLKEIVRKRVDEATKQNNDTEIIRYAASSRSSKRVPIARDGR